jgi:ribosomal protein L9
VAKATNSANKVATSQVALPADVCTTVYAADGYSQSVRNLQQVSLDKDNVFGDDNGVRRLATVTVTVSVSSGLTVALTVPV